MSKRTREGKNAKSQQPAKHDAISIRRKFAQPYGKARLQIDHTHSYRGWNIVGQCDVPGFFYLESRFRLNPGELPASYTVFELCLHESQFERASLWAFTLIQNVILTQIGNSRKKVALISCVEKTEVLTPQDQR